MAGEEPKLIIDTDWKSQAQAEKERLAQKSAPAKPAPAPGGAPGAHPGEGELPKEIKFEDLVGLLASQAMQYLGYFPDPETGQAMISLEYAKLHIDMLGILEDKTKNNLSDTEQKFLQKMLTQLRLDFVEVTKAVAKAVKEGRIKPQGGPGQGIMTAGGPPPGAPGITTPGMG